MSAPLAIGAIGAVAALAALAALGAARGRRGSRSWTQRDAEKAGADWQGVNSPDDVSAAALVWRYDSAYPADRLLGLMPSTSRRGWSEWLWQENAMRTEDVMGGSVEDDLEDQWIGPFKDWWLSTPEEEPIVLVEDAAGRPEGIWDGWHRAAVSIVMGGPGATLPVFVGRRRG